MSRMTNSTSYMGQAIRAGLDAENETFHKFFECWIVEQDQHLQQLVSALNEHKEHHEKRKHDQVEIPEEENDRTCVPWWNESLIIMSITTGLNPGGPRTTFSPCTIQLGGAASRMLSCWSVAGARAWRSTCFTPSQGFNSSRGLLSSFMGSVLVTWVISPQFN